MPELYSSTSIIGQLLSATTINVTGDFFLTLCLLIIVIMGFVFLFRLPIEASLIIIFPLMLVIGAYNGGQILSITMALSLYMGFFIAKYWFF